MKNLKKNSSTWSQVASIFLIFVYQRIRPYLDQVILTVFGSVSRCRQNPTCSDYTIAQIRSHGTIAGIRLGIIRIISCRPNL